MKTDQSSTDVEHALAKLHVSLAYDATQHSLRVACSIRNKTDAALMVLDRGMRTGSKGGDVPTKESPPPLIKREGADVTLTHAALALPKPAPTVPRMTLAARVEPGAEHASQFNVDVPADAKRVRYCVGVAPFAEDAFTAEAADATTWRASFRIAESQTLLCTPWLDLSTSKFDSK